MPTLLQYTSLLYAIPAFLSWMPSQCPNTTPIFQHGLSAVVLTSYTYHGNNYDNLPLKIVDMTLGHFMVLYHAYRGFFYATLTWHVVVMYAAILYSGTIFWFLGLSQHTRNGDLWHATIHATTALGSTALLCARGK